MKKVKSRTAAVLLLAAAILAATGHLGEFVNAVSGRDYTMIMGLTIFMGMVVIIVNLAMDILRMILEPSVRMSK